MSTASEEQVERVKIAVREEWGSRLCREKVFDRRECDLDNGKCACRDVARAAIAAMGEPQAERFEEALWRIQQWSKAYPLTVFPEPDLVKAAELLKAGGITLDAVSAYAMRHVVEGVGKIAAEALEGRAAMGEQWREISEAPTDGTQVDLWITAKWISGGGYGREPDCWFSEGKWWRHDELYGDDQNRYEVRNASHFMSRPPSPVTS